jgi:hypothetical protein
MRRFGSGRSVTNPPLLRWLSWFETREDARGNRTLSKGAGRIVVSLARAERSPANARRITKEATGWRLKREGGKHKCPDQNDESRCNEGEKNLGHTVQRRTGGLVLPNQAGRGGLTLAA